MVASSAQNDAVLSVSRALTASCQRVSVARISASSAARLTAGRVDCFAHPDNSTNSPATPKLTIFIPAPQNLKPPHTTPRMRQSRPPLYHHAVINRFKAHLRRCGLLQPGDRLAIAVSGGADSVALLRLMLEFREELGII